MAWPAWQLTTTPSATTEGMILGTPDYIAPEQAANARAADIRSDIYSLGGTLYFALTGQPPFPKGSFVEKLTLHSTKEPEPIRALRPDVPPEFGAGHRANDGEGAQPAVSNAERSREGTGPFCA